MKKILLATTNLKKIAEFKELCQLHNNHKIQLLSLHDLKIADDEAPENSATFEGNALQKANYYWEKYKIPVICDDSGLEVFNLNLFPGVNSKRWLEEKGFVFKITKLLAMLEGKDSGCQYMCALAYRDDKYEQIFIGKFAGKLVQPHHQESFGFDIGFYVAQYQKTFSEIDVKLKNQISHRGKAFRQLQSWIAQTF